jgi:hypothetical protein
MHRTGTSALTGLIGLLGFHVGREEELIPAKPDNPRGFWERQEISDLHHSILAELGACWDALLEAKPERLSEETRRSFVRRVSEAVEAMDRHAPWVVKDPLLCLLFPLWRERVKEPVAILIHRSPIQVAESLRRRNGLPLVVGVALWELYNLSALEHTRDMPRLLVQHRRLMEQPVVVAEEVASFLGGLGAKLQPIPRLEIERFIDPGLIRAEGGTAELRPYLNSARERLVAALETGDALAGGFRETFSDDARDVLKLHGDHLRSKADLEAALRGRDALFEEKNTLLEQAADLARERDLYFEEKNRLLGDLGRYLEERDQYFKEKVALMEERDALAARLGEFLKNS